MFASDMRKSIDNPGCLVITPICKGGTTRILALRRQKLKVCSIDEPEDMLSPSHQVLPSSDIVPYVRKSISPSTQKQFEFTRLDIKISLVGLRQTLANDTRVMKLNELLEILQQRNMSVRNALWQLMPFADRELNCLVADFAELRRSLSLIM